MAEAATTIAVDKGTMREELERTREAFRALVSRMPDDWWGATSGNSAFTCGQLAWHVASGVDFSAGLVEAARAGKQQTVPSFLMPLGYKINELRIRRRSRNATRDSVLADYDRAHVRLLRLLDEVSEEEMAVVKTNFGQTRSVREMLMNPVEHFAEHAPEIESVL